MAVGINDDSPIKSQKYNENHILREIRDLYLYNFCNSSIVINNVVLQNSSDLILWSSLGKISRNSLWFELNLSHDIHVLLSFKRRGGVVEL